MVMRPSKRPSLSMIGSFSTRFEWKIFSASSNVQPFGAVMSGALVILSFTGVPLFVSKRKSRLVRMPIKILFSSTTGTPEI